MYKRQVPQSTIVNQVVNNQVPLQQQSTGYLTSQAPNPNAPNQVPLQQQSTGYLTSQAPNPNAPTNQVPIQQQLTGNVRQELSEVNFTNNNQTASQQQNATYMPHVDDTYSAHNIQNINQQYTGPYNPNLSNPMYPQPPTNIGNGQQQNQPIPIIQQPTGSIPPTSFGMPYQTTGNFSLPQQATGGYIPQTQQGISVLQQQTTGFLPPTNFNPTLPLTAQKTGYGNNELYAQSNFLDKVIKEDNDVIAPEEKSLYYKIFETYDAGHRGYLESGTAVEIFRKSGLNRTDLEHIWNLCDTTNNGQLNKQEFVVGMHLVYGKLNGKPLPNKLPAKLVPSSEKIIDNVKNQLKININSNSGNRSFTKTDASNFKNNDEKNVLPSFRNRRKKVATSTEQPAQLKDAKPTNLEVAMKNENLKLEEVNKLKKAIATKEELLRLSLIHI